jgi:hypothetical protein
MNTGHSFSWRGMTMICLVILISAGALIIVKETGANSVSTTIQVNSTDGGTGGPECRLRDAISAANTGSVVGGCDGSAGGPYIIELIDPGYNLYYWFNVIDNNSNGLPIITSDVTINGHGGKIYRNSQETTPNFRLFEVATTGTLHLNAVTISDGGFVNEGGNLKNLGDTYIQDAVIRSGHATDGAGIYNKGDLSISQSSLLYNSAGCGGGIWNDETGVLTITNSHLLGNTADTCGGGGINNGGSAVIQNCDFSGNAGAEGGGISSDGTLDVESSLFYNNTAHREHSANGGGGAIAVSLGDVTLTNSSFVSNYSPLQGGGAIANGSLMTLTNCTFSYNTSTMGSAIHNTSNLTLRNSIIANGMDSDGCSGWGTIHDGGGNLRWPATDYSCVGVSGDPQLEPLADKGGPTKTMALPIGSAALQLATTNCPASDQRGMPRDFRFSRCDAGAYELQLSFLFLPAVYNTP